MADISKIIFKMIDNAIKANSNNILIRVKISNRIEICVSDNGEGITPNLLIQLGNYDNFYEWIKNMDSIIILSKSKNSKLKFPSVKKIEIGDDFSIENLNFEKHSMGKFENEQGTKIKVVSSTLTKYFNYNSEIEKTMKKLHEKVQLISIIHLEIQFTFKLKYNSYEKELTCGSMELMEERLKNVFNLQNFPLSIKTEKNKNSVEIFFTVNNSMKKDKCLIIFNKNELKHGMVKFYEYLKEFSKNILVIIITSPNIKNIAGHELIFNHLVKKCIERYRIKIKSVKRSLVRNDMSFKHANDISLITNSLKEFNETLMPQERLKNKSSPFENCVSSKQKQFKKCYLKPINI